MRPLQIVYNGIKSEIFNSKHGQWIHLLPVDALLFPLNRKNRVCPYRTREYFMRILTSAITKP